MFESECKCALRCFCMGSLSFFVSTRNKKCHVVFFLSRFSYLWLRLRYFASAKLQIDLHGAPGLIVSSTVFRYGSVASYRYPDFSTVLSLYQKQCAIIGFCIFSSCCCSSFRRRCLPVGRMKTRSNVSAITTDYRTARSIRYFRIRTD